MRVPTIFVNVAWGSPGKTLDGRARAILVLRRNKLQVLGRLTRTAKLKVAAFQRERKEKASGLMFGLEGRGTVGTAAWLRTTFLRRALCATKDTPGRGSLASTATSGFLEFYKSNGEDPKNSSEKRIHHAITPCRCFMTKSGVMIRHLTRRKGYLTTEYLLSWERCKSRFIFSQRHRDRDGDEWDHPLTRTTYPELCPSCCNSPT